MTFAPRHIAELSAGLQKAHVGKIPLGPYHLGALNQILEHSPQDMIASVQAGVSLQDFQNHLAISGQWLPIDAPRPAQTSIGALLAWDLSGPRRFGFGTVREHLIGIKVVLPDGRIIQNGGKVVKNVAGYDLCKLFVGSRNTLGIIVEATFKLRPLPPKNLWLSQGGNLVTLGVKISRILDSALTPTVLDLFRFEDHKNPTLILAVEGTAEEVAWQGELAHSLGFTPVSPPDYSPLQPDPWDPTSQKISLLPTTLIAEISRLAPSSFVARAGNGVAYFPASSTVSSEPPLASLMNRVKSIYDPNRVLSSW